MIWSHLISVECSYLFSVVLYAEFVPARYRAVTILALGVGIYMLTSPSISFLPDQKLV